MEKTPEPDREAEKREYLGDLAEKIRKAVIEAGEFKDADWEGLFHASERYDRTATQDGKVIELDALSTYESQLYEVYMTYVIGCTGEDPLGLMD